MSTAPKGKARTYRVILDEAKVGESDVLDGRGIARNSVRVGMIEADTYAQLEAEAFGAVAAQVLRCRAETEIAADLEERDAPAYVVQLNGRQGEYTIPRLLSITPEVETQPYQPDSLV